MADQHDTVLPPPPSLPQSPPPSGDWAAQIIVARNEAATAKSVADEARADVARLEKVLGHAPDPAQDIEGAGLIGVVNELVVEVRSDRLTAKRKREARLSAIKTVGAALGVLGAAGGLVAGLVKFVQAML